MRFLICLLTFSFMGGCGTAASSAVSTTHPADIVATTDAASGSDTAGVSDAAAEVAGDVSNSDAASDGAGKSTPWGPISGACGVLAGELASPQPSFYVNTWKFDVGGPFDPKPLRPGAQARYSGPNAGGSSKCSETMSMQLLYECEGAVTLKTETEISYAVAGDITDWLASFGGAKIGVSVTRAYMGPTIETYNESDATTLLKKKLGGVLKSTANVAPADKWQKQIVHIWTLHADWVPTLQTAWQNLDAATKANTIRVGSATAFST